MRVYVAVDNQNEEILYSGTDEAAAERAVEEAVRNALCSGLADVADEFEITVNSMGYVTLTVELDRFQIDSVYF